MTVLRVHLAELAESPRPGFVRIVTLAAVMAAGFGAFGADNSLEATLARMDRAAAGFKGLTADLRKISHTAVIDQDTIDIGAIVVKRPKPHDIRMLIDIKQPDPKQAAMAGARAEIYYPKIKTVDIYDLGKNRAMVEQFLLLGFGSNSKDLESAYSIELGGPETIGGEKTTRIALIPKSKDVLQHIKKVELWISDNTGTTVQQKFYEPGGDYSLATYSNIRPSAFLSDDAVKLILPKDVKREYPQK